MDIYSYGLMLFVMMTNGHKPFEELSAGFEIDKFIVEVRWTLLVSTSIRILGNLAVKY